VMQGRFRNGEIDDHFASVKKRRKIVGNRNTRTATARCLSGIVAYSVMALPFDRTGKRQGGRILNKRNQPTAHPTGSPRDNDVDHGMSTRAKTILAI
jgi:hypothetical protein